MPWSWQSSAPLHYNQISDFSSRLTFKHIQQGTNMLEASWQGVVIAKTEKFEKVEGNYYFPVVANEKAIITETTSARICYNKIDASNPNHKIIYVEKVVSLPSRNEKR